ncbi:MAG: hypothetical protein NWE77_02800 [Candidatus Bathyarchaeota archaeon]|nr:hypothetical protein [Candidatus Bathyarchaeota archaeon]
MNTKDYIQKIKEETDSHLIMKTWTEASKSLELEDLITVHRACSSIIVKAIRACENVEPTKI